MFVKDFSCGTAATTRSPLRHYASLTSPGVVLLYGGRSGCGRDTDVRTGRPMLVFLAFADQWQHANARPRDLSPGQRRDTCCCWSLRGTDGAEDGSEHRATEIAQRVQNQIVMCAGHRSAERPRRRLADERRRHKLSTYQAPTRHQWRRGWWQTSRCRDRTTDSVRSSDARLPP